MYKYVLFDLDGTLTDSKEGIIKSVAYALEQMGESTEGRLDQHTIVGPPLLTTFEDVYGFSPEKARQTYAYFQERYSTIGKFENRAFDGIVPMLKAMKEAGIRSFVATSKPQVHAGRFARNSASLPMWKPLPDRPSAGLIPRPTSCGASWLAWARWKRATLSWSATAASTSSAPTNWACPSSMSPMAMAMKRNGRPSSPITRQRP